MRLSVAMLVHKYIDALRLHCYCCNAAFEQAALDVTQVVRIVVYTHKEDDMQHVVGVTAGNRQHGSLPG